MAIFNTKGLLKKHLDDARKSNPFCRLKAAKTSNMPLSGEIEQKKSIQKMYDMTMIYPHLVALIDQFLRKGPSKQGFFD